MGDLKDRTREFSLRIIRLCAALPTQRDADVIARQLPKSGLEHETSELIAIFVSLIKKWRKS